MSTSSFGLARRCAVAVSALVLATCAAAPPTASIPASPAASAATPVPLPAATAANPSVVLDGQNARMQIEAGGSSVTLDSKHARITVNGLELSPSSGSLSLPTASAVQPGHIIGSGVISDAVRPVAPFTAISFRATGDVLIEQAARDSLTIQAEDNVLPHLTSEVRNGELVLSTRNTTSLSATKPIRYHITVRDLSKLTISGTGTVTARAITTDALTVQSSGTVNISISGAVRQQTVELQGTGQYDATELQSERATIAVLGTGSVSVQVSDALNVTLRGTGSLEYSGTPALTQQIVGTGTIRQRSP